MSRTGASQQPIALRRRSAAMGRLGRDERPGRHAAARDRLPTRGRDERGNVALELVVLTPILVLLVLFVLWAGRGGQVTLTADLAAEEAAAAAALCCDEDDPQTPDVIEGEYVREAVVEEVLRTRPGLELLCVGGVRPAVADPDDPAAVPEFVGEDWLSFTNPATGSVNPSTPGLGALEVGFTCETDGAVAPLRGLFPTVTFEGRAAEVAFRPSTPIGVGFEDATGTVPEGTAFTVTISAEKPLFDDTDVELTWREGTATPESEAAGPPRATPPDHADFFDDGTLTVQVTEPTSLSGTLSPRPSAEVPGPFVVTMPAGSTKIEIEIPTNDEMTTYGSDGLYEDDETVILEITGVTSNSGGADRDPGRHRWTGTLEQSGSPPRLVCAPVEPSGRVTEGADLDFGFLLTRPTADQIVIDVTTTDLGATAADDYHALSTQIIFEPGSQLARPPVVTVETIDDLEPEEGDESVGLVLTEPTGSLWPGYLDPLPPDLHRCAGVIRDNESILRLRPAGSSEGGDLTFRLTLDQPADAASRAQRVTVHLTVPSMPGPDSSVRRPAGLVRTSCPTTEAMIDANDGAADFWLDPADWDGHDRTDPDSPLPGTFRHVVNFEVGDNERTVTIPTCEDRVSELRDGSYGEQLELRAVVAMGPAVTDPTATRAGGYGVLGTIVEDDIAQVIVDPLPSAEEIDGELTFEVTLQVPDEATADPDDFRPARLTEPVTVDWETDDGTGSSPASGNRTQPCAARSTVDVDYVIDDGTLTFAAGATAGAPATAGQEDVDVEICDDLRDPEADETLDLVLSNPRVRVTPGVDTPDDDHDVAGLFDGDPEDPEPADHRVTGTIENTRAPMFTATGSAVPEGQVLTFEIELDRPRAGQSVTVDYAIVARSATESDAGMMNGDYEHLGGDATGTLTFPRGATPLPARVTCPSATVCRLTVQTLTDTRNESNELVHLRLTLPPGQPALLGDPHVGVGVIQNVGPAVVNIDDVAVDEGETAEFTVSVVDTGGDPFLDSRRRLSVARDFTVNAVLRDRDSGPRIGTPPAPRYSAESAADLAPWLRSGMDRLSSGSLGFRRSQAGHEDTISVRTVADDLLEREETFGVHVSLADPASRSESIGDGIGIATISDTDTPRLRLCTNPSALSNIVPSTVVTGITGTFFDTCTGRSQTWSAGEGDPFFFEVAIERQVGGRWVEATALSDVTFDIAVVGGTADEDDFGQARIEVPVYGGPFRAEFERLIVQNNIAGIPGNSRLNDAARMRYVDPAVDPPQSISLGRSGTGLRVTIPQGRSRVRYVLPTVPDDERDARETFHLRLSRPVGISSDRNHVTGRIDAPRICVDFDLVAAGAAELPSIEIEDATVVEGLRGAPEARFARCLRPGIGPGNNVVPGEGQVNHIVVVSRLAVGGTAQPDDFAQHHEITSPDWEDHLVGSTEAVPLASVACGGSSLTNHLMLVSALSNRNVTTPRFRSRLDSIQFRPLLDGIDEEDETYTVEYNWKLVYINRPGGQRVDCADDYVQPTWSTATITIVDRDDPPDIRIGNATAAEGETLDFEVRLSAPSGKPVTFEYQTRERTSGVGIAVAGTDYADIYETDGDPDTDSDWHTATIDPGDMSHTISVDALADGDADELPERFFVDIRAPGSGPSPPPLNARIDDGLAVGIITERPAIAISISDDAAGEGDDVEFVVSLSEPAPMGGLDVRYATREATGDDAATSGSDFTAHPPTTLTIPAGDQSLTVAVAALPDLESETDEVFFVDLSDPVATGAPDRPLVLLDPLGQGTITGDIECYELPSRTGNYPDDLEFGTLLPPGAHAEAIDESEAGESVRRSVRISAPQPYCETQRFYLRATYRRLLYSNADEGVALGVNTATQARRTAYDYRVAETVTWPRNSLFMLAELLVRDDSLTEGDERLEVDLIHADALCNIVVGTARKCSPPVHQRRTDRASAPASMVISGTIRDDDTSTISVGSSARAAEGGRMTFTVQLDKAVGSREVSVDYRTVVPAPADGAAASPVPADDECANSSGDYEPTSGTLTIPAGQIGGTVTVQTCQDRLDEHDEIIGFELSNPTTGITLDTDCDDGDCHRADGAIADDDDPPTLRIADVSVDEGEAATLVMRLSEPSGRDITVTHDVVPHGAAAATARYLVDEPLADFQGIRGATVVVPAGQTRVTRTVQSFADDRVEPAEQFRLQLRAGEGYAAAEADGFRGIVTIRDVSDRRIVVRDASAVEGSLLRFAVEYEDMTEPAAGAGIVVEFRTVPAATANRAAAGDDYAGEFEQPASGTVRIPAGRRSAVVAIPTVDDRLDERTERVQLRLLSGTGTATSGAVLADAEAVGLIVDNDPSPSLRISDESADESAGPMRFAVELSEASGTDVTVGYATADGTATKGSVGPPAVPADYDETSGTLTIPAGDTVGYIEVPLVDDTDAEGLERFTVQLSSPRRATIDDGVGSGEIVDDEGPPLLLPADAEPAFESAGPARFEIRLSRAAAGEVTVDWATETIAGAAGATDGADFTGASGTLTFAAGDTVGYIEVTLVDDTVEEPVESFRVRFSNPSGAELSPASATVTAQILDDESLPEISVADSPAAAEGGSAVFRVSLDRVSLAPVTVGYRAAVALTAQAAFAATAGTDFVAVSARATIPARATHVDLSVPIRDDSLDEHTETFWLRLSNPSGATLGDGTAVGAIVDDDPLPKLSVSDAEAAEGEAAEFTITLDRASGREVTVHALTVPHGEAEQRATPGDDFASVSTAAANAPLRFAPGVRSATLEVRTVADTAAEADETFRLLLATPVHAVLDDDAGLGTITDNDSEPRLRIEHLTAREDASPMVFRVSLSARTGRTVTVGWATTSGTAWPECDYGSPPAGIDPTAAQCSGDAAPAGVVESGGTLVIPPNFLDAEISLFVNDDDLEEGPERFTLTLSNPTNALLSLAQSTATGTIIDDDRPNLSVGDADASEQDGTIVFEVSLDSPAGADVEVDWATVAGTATAPGDFAAASGTLTIPAGDTVGRIRVTLADDSFHEPPEQFTVQLSDPVGAGIVGQRATGRIDDDDDPPSIRVTADPAVESDDAAVIHVTLDKPSDRPVSFDFTTASTCGGTTHFWGGAEYSMHPEDGPRPDYVPTDGTVTLAAGDSATTFEIRLQDDTVREAAARTPFFVLVCDADNARFADDQGRVVGAAQWSVRVEVWDDEHPPQVFLADNPVTVAESASDFAVRVGTHFALDRDLVIGWRFAPTATGTFTGTSVPGIDNNVSHRARVGGMGPGTADDVSFDCGNGIGCGTFTLAAGQTEGAITLPGPVDDTMIESTEWFEVGLGPEVQTGPGPHPPPYEIADRPPLRQFSATKVAIIDDDATPTLRVHGTTVTEDVDTGSAQVRIVMDRASSTEVTVEYSTHNGSAHAGADYTAPPPADRTVAIAPGRTVAVVDVPIIDDGTDEQTETFEVQISNPSGAAIDSSHWKADVEIVDDDGPPAARLTVTDVAYDEGDSDTSGFISIPGRLSGWDRGQPVQFTLTAEELPQAGPQTATAGEDFSTAAVPLTVTITPCTISGGADDGGPGSTITADRGGAHWSALTLLTGCRDRQNPDGDIVFPAVMAFQALLGDDIPEQDESFYVSLYSPSNVALARNAYTVTIRDDDQPAVSVADVTVDESAASATLTLTLSAPSHVATSVAWATAAARPPRVGAVPDEDYRSVAGTASFAAGVTSATVTVPLRGDDIDEPDEVFLLVLSSPTLLTIADAVAAVTIADDDPGWWVRTDGSDAEDAGTLRFVVARDHTAADAFTLRYSIDPQAGTAVGGAACTAGIDFVTPPGSVPVPADATEVAIEIMVCDDSQAESRETLVLELTNVEGRDLVGVGTIVDNDR
ncbi:MAG: hypothetical protein OXM54_00955 [Acidimicrobiaceae bacterium]|nr:hypothetical protein [Acidimicrobiaceae bacterium]